MTEQLAHWSERLWDTLVRWRTYVVNIVLALAIVLPDILNAPEILAVLPPGWSKWAIAAALLLNILMRPRRAARARDFEPK